MATYKAEFYSHYYKGRLRPIGAYSMGLIYWWARLASFMPNLANFITQTPPLSLLAKMAGGIAQKRTIPKFAPETFKQWHQRREWVNRTGPRVVLWADTFNNHFFPEAAKAAVEVLEAAGFNVVIPIKSLCCGRPLYDFGMLSTAKHLLRQILESLAEEIEAGTYVVGLEPSCVAVFRDELVNLFPTDKNAKRLSKQTMMLAEFLEKNAPDYKLPKLHGRVLLHGHCHDKAIMKMSGEEDLLKRMGMEVDLIDSGCCGMAGSFGFEREHYDVSLQCGERVLLPAVRQAPKETFIVTDGFSCREQIGQETDRRALHFAQVVQLALKGGLGDGVAYPESRVSLSPRPRFTLINWVAAGALAAAAYSILRAIIQSRKRQ